MSSGQVPKSSNSSSSQFKIFQETNNEENQLPTSSSSKSSNSHLPFSKERNRENERDPGKWTQNRIGKKSHAIPLDKISSKPGFDIHHDEGLVTPSKSSSMAPPSHVLSSHKPKPEEDEVPIAVALFEPPDPSKKPMYCKHLVYQGVTEFSFEEIRGVSITILLEDSHYFARTAGQKILKSPGQKTREIK